MTNRRSRLTSSQKKRKRIWARARRQHVEDRQLLLEQLEQRVLLAAGPRLAGLQPNNSDLFNFDDPTANVRDVAPRELTIRFDENQQIDGGSLSGIRVVRSGLDGTFDDGNEVTVVPGFIGVAKSPKTNEVVIRFAERLPDDVYRVEIFGAGSPSPLQNVAGDAFVPSLNDGDGDDTKDTVQFELDLGPQVIAVVPEPVRRGPSGELVQARDQIVVYFNDDPLLVGDDESGAPQQSSAENPDFYQLIYTADTVRNTDDVVVHPIDVEYDGTNHTATLTFAQNLDQLRDPVTGDLIGPGTFRLRIGTDEAAPLPPQTLAARQTISSDFNTGDAVVIQLTAVRPGEQGITVDVSRRDLGGIGQPLLSVVGQRILLQLDTDAANGGAGATTAQQIVDAINDDATVRQLVVASINRGDPGTAVGTYPVNYSPLTLIGEGASFDTATELSDETDTGPVLVITGGGAAFGDGQFFEITDTSGTLRKFEFDRDVPESLNDLASIGIPFTPNASQAEMASAIVAAINNASFGVTAELAGTWVRLAGERSVDLSSGVSGLAKRHQDRFDAGPIIEAIDNGLALREGQTFEVADSSGDIVTFEFDSGYVLHVVPQLGMQVPVKAADPSQADVQDGETFVIDDGLGNQVRFEFVVGSRATANVPIAVGAGESADMVGQTIVQSIRGAVLDGALTGLDALDLQGGMIALRSTNVVTITVESGALSPLAFDAAALEGETVAIDDGTNTVVFEFDNDGLFTDIDGDLVPDNVLIAFTPADSRETVATALASAINREVAGGRLVGISAADLGDGRIHLGGAANHVVSTSGSSNVTQTGQPGVRAGSGHVVVPFVPDVSFTVNDVAEAVADAINSASATIPAFEVTASAAGNVVRLDGDQAVHLPEGVEALRATIQSRFDAGPVLDVVNTGDGLVDGQQIRIQDGRQQVLTLEFDDDGQLTNSSAVAVPFWQSDPGTGTPAATQSEVAQAIALAINASGAELSATAVGTLVYLTGDQQVELVGDLAAVVKRAQGLTLRGAIEPQPFLLDLPGNNDEPGHRQMPLEVGGGAEQHINEEFGDAGRDVTPGVTTIMYNFQTAIDGGFQNAITEEQKQRAREAFALWSNYLGVQFIESAGEGLTIATSDLRALSPGQPDVLDYPSNDFRVRIDPAFSEGLLLMDRSVDWNDDFGEDWFLNAMIGIGTMLGLDRANDLPRSTLMAFNSTFAFPNMPTPEPIFPGNADILHGQHLYRLDGTDIDMYRFTIDLAPGREGIFTAETFAERLPNSSNLDTVLTLYRENEDGTRELVARNDDYFSRDSFLELSLTGGTYYVAVSAAGNELFDPTIEDSGYGGGSQGDYELRLQFRSQVEQDNTIRDADGIPTVLDGDADGIAGGVYNFWFQTRPQERIVEITGDGTVVRDGQVVTITDFRGLTRRFEFDDDGQVAAGNVAVAFQSGANASSASTIAQNLADAINTAMGGFSLSATAQGDSVVLGGGGAPGERFISLSSGAEGIAIHGRMIYVDRNGGPDADGSLARPFNNIANPGQTNAFAAARPDDIVRIVGNGGTDQDLSTLDDNFAYEIGFGTLPGQILRDGTEMAVPQGVTVMVEPGTIFKMRRSRIGVGSSSLTVNRSGSALQVLGTPENNVFFTSWLDETIGLDTHTPTTLPGRGDWGGIVFRADVDDAENRFSLEEEGIFLNYVNQADIRYGGGGNVLIDSVQQVVNPIQIIDTRPTISFNRITQSADAAMSASPNSFEETNFHSPRFQSAGMFTSDYDRVGPDIHGNTVVDNSTNGLFIRIQTPAGNDLRPLTVAGRFDDRDIVHVLSENLIIQGHQSEPFLDLSRPEVDLVSLTPRTGGTLAPGTYQYKITFVDANGIEGRPSLATTSLSLGGVFNAIQLNQLPPATGEFVARRIYRTDDLAGGVYQLVAEINASDTVFVDTGQTLPATLQRDPPPITQVTLTSQPRGSLEGGTYNYRIVMVDALGREGASSDATSDITISGAPGRGGIRLDNLPPASTEFVARRLYRSSPSGIHPYTLVAELDATSTSYVDDGYTEGGTLDPSSFGVVRARPHARLAVDAGTVVKMEGARIEARFGAQLIAEGVVGQNVIFTSRLDDAFGAGGTFDTNNDDNQASGEQSPQPGDWGGLYFGPLAQGSLDHAQISFGGGINRIEGTFTAFNAVEIHQAEVRLTNSVIENNDQGTGGQGPLDRLGRGFNRAATIFVRGAQPILVNNIIRDNVDPSNTNARLVNAAITINANSLTSDLIADWGRSTGTVDRFVVYDDNRGPLVRDNRLDNNGLNGMVVRGEELTTQSVWDDTDIVHILTNQYDQDDALNNFRNWRFDEIVIPEHHHFGGLRLQSSPTESLVVKLLGAGNSNDAFNTNPTNGAGLTATGRRLGEVDRIGGTLQIVGQPGFPVVLTSLHDDTVGAGVRPDDKPQTDTNNNGIATTPDPGDWRSVRLDQFSNDRNVEIVLEMEPSTERAPGSNATTDTGQFLGKLAAAETSSDSQLRMGFEVHGVLSEPNDVDVYSFDAAAGTEIWFDVDRTSFTLDTIVEVLDAGGRVIARSDDTLAEATDPSQLFAGPTIPDDFVNPLQKSPLPNYPLHASGLPRDHFSTNPRDAGMRVVLPGVTGTRSTYHFAVRSKDGLTSGVYQLQLRTREVDEVPGSTVRFADIRYATNGVEAIGLPAHSPLIGEAAEDEMLDPSRASNDSPTRDAAAPGRRPQDLGNLLNADRAVVSVAGQLDSSGDVDFYNFQVRYDAISDPSTHYAAAVFDVDYADGLVRPNSILSVFDSFGRLILIGRDSNIAEDRPGPLAGPDLSDLSRGSVGEKDPFIGPVELPETRFFDSDYQVAVTSNARIPAQLVNNDLVRLEPINSVIRIAEDHIRSSGGSTALPPVVDVLLDPSQPGPGAGLWHVTNRRGNDPGHGIPASFDGSRAARSGGSSFYFGDEATGRVPAGESGTLVSQSFSLKGYSAADLPMFYFNYFLSANVNSDAFRVRLVDGNGSHLIASSVPGEASSSSVTRLQTASGNAWRQARISLAPFAGQETVRLEFEFSSPNGTGGSNSGAFVDDLIIGFAERGEMVTGASSDRSFVNNPDAPGGGEILIGEYQLEIRSATDYGQVTGGGAAPLQLTASFDTNARLTPSTTLIAPAGSDVIDGQTFVVSDGVNRVTFEFEDPDPANGNVGIRQGNVEIPFRSFRSSSGTFVDDPDYVIARRIRDAINSAQVQTILKLRAGLSDGTLSGTASTDNKVNLFGPAVIDQPAPFSVVEVTADANRLRDEIVGTGIQTVGNAVYTGGQFSAGLFEGGRDLLGMDGGILLTTGEARFADGPNTSDEATGRSSGQGDADLDRELDLVNVLGVTTTDATVLQFDFQPATSGDVYLNFLFASEEYNEAIGTIFRDALGIFIKDANDPAAGWTNLAVVPGSSPAEPVSIESINAGNPPGSGGPNEAFYHNNDPSDQGTVLDAFGYDGFTDTFTTVAAGLNAGTTYTLKIAIADVADLAGDSAVFIETASLATSPLQKDPEGIASIRFSGFGDQNHHRDQGQLLIHSNKISHARDFAIVTDAGERDFLERLFDFRPHGLLQPHMGPARHLPELNDFANTGIQGGFAPGTIIVNNTIDQAGLGGIHVSGDLRPYELVPFDGSGVCDGDAFSITMYRTTVEFEFENLGQGTTDCPANNGYTPGRVPIFYNHAGNVITSQSQMAGRIAQAIEESILVTNGTTLVGEVYTDESLVLGGASAVYVENAKDFRFIRTANIGAYPVFQTWRVVPISNAAQPFVQVVNNTIHGSDGNESFFGDDPRSEPNDTIFNAVDTKQGIAATPETYGTTAANRPRIGDSVNFRDDATQDVDFYQFQLDIGDRVTIDLDAISINSTLDAVLRLFNSVGEELAVSRADRATGTDPFIDFTATEGGTYFVGVSGAGNETYSALSLGSRQGPASTGNYDIEVNVRAPRTWVVDTAPLVNSGGTFTITDMRDRTATFSVGPTGTTRGNNTPQLVQQLTNAINSSGAIRGVSARSFGDPPTNVNLGNRLTDGRRFVVIEGAVKITSSGTPSTALRPILTGGNRNNDSGLLPETGILVSEEATPILLNNVVSNTRNGFVETLNQLDDHLARAGSNPFAIGNRHFDSPISTVYGGQMWQHNQFTNAHTSDRGAVIPTERVIAKVDDSDFNVPLQNDEVLFVNAADGNFLPERFARSIDSSIDSLEERDAFKRVKNAVGISVTTVLAPDRDGIGQLRVDDPEVDTPLGQGDNVFKDRGSLDRSDFVGPNAVLVNPRDNDADGNDRDSAVSIVQLEGGVFTDFSIQIADGFESADPFPGVGVDDGTLDGRVLPLEEEGIQLQVTGPAVTIFRDGVYLKEGIDYTYRFDRTSNTILLTPLSGIWPEDKVYVIKINNRDRFLIDAPEGPAVTDGDSFTITNDVGDTATLEFDTGYTIQVTPTLGLILPTPLTGGGGITDGQRFTINDGDNQVTFEFDRNDNVLGGNRPIPFQPNDSAETIANQIVAALEMIDDDPGDPNDLGLIKPIAPRYLGGNAIHLGVTPDHRLDLTNTALTATVTQFPFSLNIPPAGGAAIADNEAFTISSPTRTEIFEFDSDGSGSTVAGSRVIPFLVTDSADAIAGVAAGVIGSAGLGLNPVVIGGGVLELGANPGHFVDVSGSSLTRSMFIGGVRDGERFSIRYDDPNTSSVVTANFEFDNNNVFLDVNGDNIPDNTLIPFGPDDTHLDLGDKIADAIRNAGLDLDPVHVGGGKVNVGGTEDHLLDATRAPSLSVSGSPSVQPSTTLQLPVQPALQVPASGAVAFTDGETFSISDGTITVIFEFDGDGVFEDANGDTLPDNEVIRFFGGETQNDMAVRISSAIAGTGLGLTPAVLGNGVIDLGASPNHVINLTGSSLSRADRVGVVADGETFSIDDGSQIVTFEFEDVSLSDGVQGGNTAINYVAGVSVDQIADAMVAALRTAGLGLNPTNRGDGRVELGDSVRHLTDVSNSSLTLSGVPGGAVPVSIRINSSGAQVAEAIVDAVNVAASDRNLMGVSGQLRGGSTLFVDMTNAQGQPADFAGGFAAVAGIPNFFLSAVKDIPGNTLKANQATGETVFTILLPGVDLDFGDAPDPFRGTGQYPTLFDNDGARHVITDTPVYLGERVDGEVDGQPNLSATGDDQDHRVGGLDANMSVVGLAPFTVQVPISGAVGIGDNEQFTIWRGATSRTFEFDRDGSGLTGGDVLISLTGTETQQQVADKIVAAVAGELSTLVLRPANLGGGVVFLGGTDEHQLDISASSLAQTGQVPADVTVGAAGLALVLNSIEPDGARFTVDDGASQVTFEFDLNSLLTPGNEPIRFGIGDGVEEQADAIVAAIDKAVSDGLLIPMTPVHLGQGVIDFVAPAGVTIDLSGVAGGLTQTGIAGGLADGQDFTISDGNRTVVFEFDRDGRVAAGSVRVDIGELTAGVPAADADQVSAALTAAIDSAAFALTATDLGAGSVRLQGNDDDGVVFQRIITPGRDTPMSVTSSTDGLLDAWVDWNQDGDWNDPGEQIFQSEPLEAGANSLSMTVPAGSLVGDTYARFRFSTQGRLQPTGVAVDGEVEDYRIRVITNDAPIVTPGAPDSVDVDEDAADTNIPGGDVFEDVDVTNGNGDQLIFAVVANSNPLLVDASVVNGVFVLDYLANQNGQALITLSATDHGALTVEHTITVTVNAVNDAPVADDLQVQTDEDIPLDITLTGDDGDPMPNELQDLTFRILTPPSHGSLELDPGTGGIRITPVSDPVTGQIIAAQVTYLPDGNFNGSDSFTYQIDDGQGSNNLSNVANVSIDVIPVNDPPTADVIAVVPSPLEDTPVTITLTGDHGDRADEPQTLSFFIVDPPDHGQLAGVDWNDNGRVVGTLVYQPDLNFNGQDTFTYNVQDDGVPPETSLTPGLVTLQYEPVNDRPTAESFTVVAFERQLLTIDLQGDDDGEPTTSENQVLDFTIQTLPSQGSLFDGTTLINLTPWPLTSGQVNYQPADPVADFGVDDSFTYTVTDDDQAGLPHFLQSDPGVVTIDLVPVNDPPTAGDYQVQVQEDTPLDFTIPRADGSPPIPGGVVDDGDPEFDQTLTFRIRSLPAQGTLVLVDANTGIFRYTPATNENGPELFTYDVLDDGGLVSSPPATVTLNVEAVNDMPVAIAPSTTQVTDEDTPIVITLTGDDGDPLPGEDQTLNFEVVSGPSKGSLAQDAGGQVAFTRIDARTVTVTYLPGPDFNGTDQFSFRVVDDNTAGGPARASTPATVNIAVNAVNDPPQFTAGPDQVVDEDAGLQVVPNWAVGIRPGPQTAVDEVTQSVSFIVEVPPASQSLFSELPTVASDGTLRYTTAPHANGQVELTVFARDTGSPVAESARQTVTITVNAVNDPPQFIPGPSVSVNEDAGPQTFPNWARSILPGPPGALDEVSQVGDLEFEVSFTTTGNLSFSQPPAIAIRQQGSERVGDLSYAVNPNTNGSATVTVTLTDNGSGDNRSVPFVFNINVNAINDAPQFTPGADVTVDEDAGLVTIPTWATDILPGPSDATDELGQTLTFLTIVADVPQSGFFAVAPTVDATTGNLTFQTSADAQGIAVVNVLLRDNGSGLAPHRNISDPHELTITVNAVNDPPQFTLAGDQQVAEDAGPQVVGNFATNIRPGPPTALDETTQSVTGFQVINDNNALFTVQPSISPNGTLTYQPAPDAFGTATVTVTAEDDGTPPAVSAAEVFTISVTAVNDAPSLTVPGVQAVDEDQPLSLSGFQVTDVDAAEVQVTLQASGGTLKVDTTVANGVTGSQVQDNETSAVVITASPAAINTTFGATDGLIYQGLLNFNGQDTLLVSVDDLGNTGSPGSLTDDDQVRITVLPVNDPPFVENPIEDLTVPEDNPDILLELVPDVFNDPDILTNNQVLMLSVESNTNDQLVSTSITGTILTLQLAADQSGQAVIRVRAEDPDQLAVEDEFTLTVTPVNDAPRVEPDQFTVPAVGTTTLDVLDNDSDIDSQIDPTTVQLVSQPAGATATVNSDGTIDFTPGAGFRGITRFSYTVMDEQGAESEPAEVTVRVNGPPVANDDSAVTTQGSPVVIDVLSNDFDGDGELDPATVVVTSGPANGTTDVDFGTGDVTYTPDSGFNGTDTFRYTVRDKEGAVSNEAIVMIEVQPIRFWQNPDNHLDVNGDGFVSPIDALQVINTLNEQGSRPLPDPTPGNAPPPFYDVNGDGVVSPIDALVVIDALNTGEAEGEAMLAGAGVAEGEAGSVVQMAVSPGFWEVSGSQDAVAGLEPAGAAGWLSAADATPAAELRRDAVFAMEAAEDELFDSWDDAASKREDASDLAADIDHLLGSGDNKDWGLDDLFGSA